MQTKYKIKIKEEGQVLIWVILDIFGSGTTIKTEFKFSDANNIFKDFFKADSIKSDNIFENFGIFNEKPNNKKSKHTNTGGFFNEGNEQTSTKNRIIGQSTEIRSEIRDGMKVT